MEDMRDIDGLATIIFLICLVAIVAKVPIALKIYGVALSILFVYFMVKIFSGED